MATSGRNDRNYVQFSKRMVLLVMGCVNVMVLVCVIGMMIIGDISAMAETMKHYLGFGGVVFVAYCGNSAIEKAALAWAGRREDRTDQEADDNG